MGPIRDSGFHSILISVSNPCDVVTEYLYRNLGLPRSQVFGTGTLLDSARLRRALSEIIGVNSKQIQAICMGEHGDSSFCLLYTSILWWRETGVKYAPPRH